MDSPFSIDTSNLGWSIIYIYISRGHHVTGYKFQIKLFLFMNFFFVSANSLDHEMFVKVHIVGVG